jgi:hypothetical protein
MTDKSKENNYRYLFTCEVKDMKILEKDILYLQMIKIQ